MRKQCEKPACLLHSEACPFRLSCALSLPALWNDSVGMGKRGIPQ
jgi:hypothetical protein